MLFIILVKFSICENSTLNSSDFYCKHCELETEILFYFPGFADTKSLIWRNISPKMKFSDETFYLSKT